MVGADDTYSHEVKCIARVFFFASDTRSQMLACSFSSADGLHLGGLAWYCRGSQAAPQPQGEAEETPLSSNFPRECILSILF